MKTTRASIRQKSWTRRKTRQNSSIRCVLRVTTEFLVLSKKNLSKNELELKYCSLHNFSVCNNNSTRATTLPDLLHYWSAPHPESILVSCIQFQLNGMYLRLEILLPTNSFAQHYWFVRFVDLFDSHDKHLEPSFLYKNLMLSILFGPLVYSC